MPISTKAAWSWTNGPDGADVIHDQSQHNLGRVLWMHFRERPPDKALKQPPPGHGHNMDLDRKACMSDQAPVSHVQTCLIRTPVLQGYVHVIRPDQNFWAIWNFG